MLIEQIVFGRIPAENALKQFWAEHRYAGSGDRASISLLVFDALRRRLSSAYIMCDDTSRGIILGTLAIVYNQKSAEISRLFSQSPYAPPSLSAAEAALIDDPDLSKAPPHIAGDIPEFLAKMMSESMDNLLQEGQALALRAPLDLRANKLRTTRDVVVEELKHLSAEPTPFSPIGVRIKFPADGRRIKLKGEQIFVEGKVETQDEGSQLASLLAEAKPGELVIDLCAGAGGKSLALAAEMGDRGKIIASDKDRERLMQSLPRIKNSNTSIIELVNPINNKVQSELANRADLVFIDCPCTGCGTWRRHPDAKWRIRSGSLAERIKNQEALLQQAATFVRPGGRIFYVVCSLLRQEGDDQIEKFLKKVSSFSHHDFSSLLAENKFGKLASNIIHHRYGIGLTPYRTGTDGFYISQLDCHG